MAKKKLKIEVEWKLLERIAEFYQFPTTVFLGNLKVFPKRKTREDSFRKKAELFDKIKEGIEDGD